MRLSLWLASVLPEKSSVRIKNKKQETEPGKHIERGLHLSNLPGNKLAQRIKNKARANADGNIKRKAHQRHHSECWNRFRVVCEVNACDRLQHEQADDNQRRAVRLWRDRSYERCKEQRQCKTRRHDQ